MGGLIRDYVDEEAAILSRFLEKWTTGVWDPDANVWEPLTPVAYPGRPFITPGAEGGPQLQPWVRIQVLGGDAERASIGGRVATYRHRGTAAIEVFVPVAERDKALSLADRAAGIFRAWEYGGIVFLTPRVHHVGMQGGWYRKNVLCPFWRTSTFAHQ